MLIHSKTLGLSNTPDNNLIIIFYFIFIFLKYKMITFNNAVRQTHQSLAFLLAGTVSYCIYLHISDIHTHHSGNKHVVMWS